MNGIRELPNPNIETFVDDLVEWVFEHLTPGQRAVAAQTVLYQLQAATFVLADLRVQLCQEMRDDGFSLAKIGTVLGISQPTVGRMFKKAQTARKTGGYANNKVAYRNRWNKVRRDYGMTAGEREANGFEPVIDRTGQRTT